MKLANKPSRRAKEQVYEQYEHNLGFKTKTRAFEENQVFERENERKEYRMGELGDIHGQFLGYAFVFSSFHAIRDDLKLSLSLWRNTQEERGRGGGERERKKDLEFWG